MGLEDQRICDIVASVPEAEDILEQVNAIS